MCLIGQTLVRELFEGESPVGKEIRVNNHPFKVVGMLSRKGANMMGMDQDDIVLAPWTTIKFKVSGQSAQTGNQSNSSLTDNLTIPSEASQLYPSQQPSPYPVQSARRRPTIRRRCCRPTSIRSWCGPPRRT